jgi:hypothetical protein
LALGPKLGLVNDKFQFSLFPDRGVTCGIEALDNLRSWNRIVTFTNLDQAQPVLDQDSAQHTRRFYRAVSP